MQTEFYLNECKKCHWQAKSPKGKKPDCIVGDQWEPLKTCYFCGGDMVQRTVIDEADKPTVVMNSDAPFVSVDDFLAENKIDRGGRPPLMSADIPVIKFNLDSNFTIESMLDSHIKTCKGTILDLPSAYENAPVTLGSGGPVVGHLENVRSVDGGVVADIALKDVPLPPEWLALPRIIQLRDNSHHAQT